MWDRRGPGAVACRGPLIAPYDAILHIPGILIFVAAPRVSRLSPPRVHQDSLDHPGEGRGTMFRLLLWALMLLAIPGVAIAAGGPFGLGIIVGEPTASVKATGTAKMEAPTIT